MSTHPVVRCVPQHMEVLGHCCRVVPRIMSQTAPNTGGGTSRQRRLQVPFRRRMRTSRTIRMRLRRPYSSRDSQSNMRCGLSRVNIQGHLLHIRECGMIVPEPRQMIRRFVSFYLCQRHTQEQNSSDAPTITRFHCGDGIVWTSQAVWSESIELR